MACAVARAEAVVAPVGDISGGLDEEVRDEALVCELLDVESQADSSDERTPTTTASECSDVAVDEELESVVAKVVDDLEADDVKVMPQLGPGLFPSEPLGDDGVYADDGWGLGVYEDGERAIRPLAPTPDLPDDVAANVAEPVQAVAAAAAAAGGAEGAAAVGASAAESATMDGRAEAAAPREPSDPFAREETLFLLDWDDTVLPSTWIQRHGLRLDEGSALAPWQRQLLAEVASVASETIRLAKQRGTVVVVTNAERGWIELSCSKFLPGLGPAMEGVKLVSARTTYEGPGCLSPLDWKIAAFEAEIASACEAKALADPASRKNIHSLGDSIHEREALLRAAAPIANCRSKSLKFAERPDIMQLIKQHELIVECFDRIVDWDDHLDVYLTIA